MYRFLRKLVYFIICVFSKTEIIGAENIQSGNVVFTCNHQSIVDALVTFAILPENTYFIAKNQLFNNKIFSFVLSKVKVFPVNRGTADLKAIKFACKVLESGANLVIFPQGTRKKEPVMNVDDIHGGTGMIAIRQKSTVIPMAFVQKPMLFKKNTLVIGKPMDISKFFEKRLNSETLKEFSKAIASNTNVLLGNNNEISNC